MGELQKITDGETYYDTIHNQTVQMLLANDFYQAWNQLENSSYTVAQPNFYYELYDTGGATEDADQANSTALTKYTGGIIFCQVLDTCDDSSVDSGIWSSDTNLTATTTGGVFTVTEDATYLYIRSASATWTAAGTGDEVRAITDGASGFDGRSLGGDSEVVMLVTASANDTGRTLPYARLEISNGSTHVTLKEWDNDATTITPTFYRIVINKSAETCDVYEEDVLIGDDVDISSVTTNWYLRFRVHTDYTGGAGATNNNNYIRVYGIGWHDGGADTSYFVQNAQTITSGQSTFAADYEWSVEPTTLPDDVTYAYSTNGGGTYGTAVAFKTLAKAQSAGTSAVWKISVDLPTSIDTSAKNCPVLTKWGAYHG